VSIGRETPGSKIPWAGHAHASTIRNKHARAIPPSRPGPESACSSMRPGRMCPWQCEMQPEVWFGLVWFGIVWFGLVWFDLIWIGLVWFGLVPAPLESYQQRFFSTNLSPRLHHGQCAGRGNALRAPFNSRCTSLSSCTHARGDGRPRIAEGEQGNGRGG